MHRKQPTEIGLGLNGNSRQRRTAARKWAALGYYVRHFGGGIGQVVLSPTPFRLGEARMAPARVPPNVGANRIDPVRRGNSG